MKHLIGNQPRNARSLALGHQRQHQVDCRGTAAEGIALAVDLVELQGRIDPGELLAKGVDILLVDGAAVTVEQAGAGE